MKDISRTNHGRTQRAGEPLVFHCNFYNYWVQKTLLLDPDLGMEEVLHDAAASVVHAYLTGQFGPTRDPRRVREVAARSFAEHGLGLMDLSGLGPDGGEVSVPVSHYGQCLAQAIDVPFERPQTWFDAGFAAAGSAFMAGESATSRRGHIEACASLGAPAGRIAVRPAPARVIPAARGIGPHGEVELPGVFIRSRVPEPDIVDAVLGLDLSGNEEGLIPRFGVMLTHHFANYYNVISFEFLRRMEGTGLLEAGEELLRDAGYRCAFHTFGGIMTSPEWDALVRPHLRTREDWVHGIVAVVNALGWGVWRVRELTEEHLVLHIYDDYESTGYLAHYGAASRPVAHLACGGAAGIMNLVHLAALENRPQFSLDFYEKLFETEESFVARETRSRASGADFTEIVAERGGHVVRAGA